MMRRSLPLLTLILLPLCLSAQDKLPSSSTPVLESAYGQKLKIKGIHNAGKITNVLYRGAQPKQEGLEELKKSGVTTIVDLRGEDHDKAEWERKQTEALGMRFVHIAVSGWSPPTNEQVVQFLSLFRENPKKDNPKQKVFVPFRRRSHWRLRGDVSHDLRKLVLRTSAQGNVFLRIQWLLAPGDESVYPRLSRAAKLRSRADVPSRPCRSALIHATKCQEGIFEQEMVQLRPRADRRRMASFRTHYIRTYVEIWFAIIMQKAIHRATLPQFRNTKARS